MGNNLVIFFFDDTFFPFPLPPFSFFSAVWFCRRIIISEHGLDTNEKQVRPIQEDLGFSGGEKFIVNSIIFKVLFGLKKRNK